MTCRDYNDECFKGHQPSGRENIVIRGCFLGNLSEDSQNDRIDENQTNVNIKTCFSSLCNDENFTQEYCIRCNSSQLNGSCYSDFTPSMMVSCQKLVISEHGCFSAVNLALGEVTRDCVSTFPMQTIKSWDIDTCYGEFCNSKDYKKSEEESHNEIVSSTESLVLQLEAEPAVEIENK